jgi:hypothetical protein
MSGGTTSHPFVYGRPVRPDEFLNRESELRTVFNRLRNGESTAVVGEPHIGKTSLLLKLADEAAQRTCGDAVCLVVSYLDLHHIGGGYTPVAFWKKALKPLWEHPSNAAKLEEVFRADYIGDPLEELFDYLDGQGQRLVLLLDEFDRLLVHPNFQDPAFFGLLHSSARTGGIALVTASRWPVAKMNEQGRRLLDAGSPFFNIMIDEHLRPFEETAIEKLLDRAGDSLSLDDRRFIRLVAGRHPFLLQAMAAAMVETTGDDRQARAAERFYERISFHFDDLWHSLDDETRTTAVILSLVELGKRALGQRFACGEIENAPAFGPELRKLAKRGLAERVGRGWQFDRQHLLLWRNERWTIGTQALAWWVRDVVIAEAGRVPIYDEWLANKRYRILLTQEQCNWLENTVRSAPGWAVRGVGALVRALVEELLRRD